MKIREGIRQKASQIFDVLIPENQWMVYVNELDRNGKFDRLAMLKMIMLLSENQEKLEHFVEDLYFRVELLEGKKSTPEVKPEIKLITPMDIYAKFTINPDTKALYVSEMDWQVLAKVTKELGKEVDPKDGKEKTCLTYKDLPIFKDYV